MLIVETSSRLKKSNRLSLNKSSNSAAKNAYYKELDDIIKLKANLANRDDNNHIYKPITSI